VAGPSLGRGDQQSECRQNDPQALFHQTILLFTSLNHLEKCRREPQMSGDSDVCTACAEKIDCEDWANIAADSNLVPLPVKQC
jgi:hypothetical protein